MKKRIWILVLSVVLAIGVFGGCNDSQTHFSVSFVKNAPAGVQGNITNMPDGIAKVERGSTITKPTKEPALYNYVFGGWYKEGACNNAWDFDNDVVDKKILLYAKWTHISETVCNVDFIANLSIAGEKIAQDHYVKDLPDRIEGIAKGATLAAPQKTPYLYLKSDPDQTKVLNVVTFDGWYTESNCQNKFLFGETPLENHIVLYARWKTVGEYEPFYTVTFNANKPADVIEDVEGMPVDITDIADGGTIEEPEEIPTLEGYEFDGWYIDSDCITAWNFEEGEVSENMMLYAKWIEAEPDEPEPEEL